MANHDLFDTNKLHPNVCVERLNNNQCAELLSAVIAVIEKSPFFRPVLPRWGTPFSVQMTNCGPLGWVSDKSGYRYQPTHPVTGDPWPPMPDMLTEIWQRHADYAHPPEACLINYYTPTAKMGLHQDKGEADFDAPVVSVSLGDDARFRLGGRERKGPTQSTILQSGDVMLLAGGNRLAFHGVDRIYPGTSDSLATRPDLFPDGGRLNLTLRRVTRG